jgi:multiple sugar transport system ATP-binding protein
MAFLEISGLRKRFGSLEVLKGIDLTLNKGGFLVLIGPSGCGKSTLLSTIAGLETISAGEIRIEGQRINDLHPSKRDIAMVFQSYALYPNMTVAENMAFGMEMRGVAKPEREKAVAEVAKTLQLEHLLKRRPSQLSGGQRQRVAMGRAIVRQPSAFLMDEPLSNLDAKLRVAMRAEIAGIQQRLGVTTVYVTHDQVEAMTMGDRVAVMRKGELQQVASPQELYDHPVNLFVGGFIGSPSMNMLEATLDSSNGAMVVKLGAQSLTLDDQTLAAHPELRSFEGRDVIVGIRPEDIEDAAQSPGARPDTRLKGKVELREALGSEIMVHLSVDARAAQTDDVRELAEDVGVPKAGDDSQTSTTIVGRYTPRSRVTVGDDVEAVVDTRNLHFFDPESGLGIYDGSAKGASA